MAGISKELDALACNLISIAIEHLEADGSLPVLLAADCENDILTFEDDTPDGCYRAACQQVRQLGSTCNRYAIVYDGIVQADESDPGAPALLVEFAERGADEAWGGYLLYRRATDGSLEVADPLPAGAEEPLFA